MSAAELRVQEMYNNIYRTYNLGSLSDEEKHYLIYLVTNGLTSTTHTSNSSKSSLLEYTADELRSRVIEADKEVLEGKTRPIEEFFEEVEQKYPWICK